MTTQEVVQCQRWTEKEVELLVSAYLNISVDPIVGNNQKGDSFWKAVTKYYCDNAKENGCNCKIRGLDALRKKWKNISRDVHKFGSYFDKIATDHPSGYNEYDYIDMAKAQFEQETKSEFKYINAWKVMRSQPKWMPVPDAGIYKSQEMHPPPPNVSSVGSETQSFGTGAVEQRPIGQKKAKRLKKAYEENCSSSMSSEKKAILSEYGKKIEAQGERWDRQNSLMENQNAILSADVMRKLLELDVSRMTTQQKNVYTEALTRCLTAGSLSTTSFNSGTTTSNQQEAVNLEDD